MPKGGKADRQIGHIVASEEKLGRTPEESKRIAYATQQAQENKRKGKKGKKN